MSQLYDIADSFIKILTQTAFQTFNPYMTPWKSLTSVMVMMFAAHVVRVNNFLQFWWPVAQTESWPTVWQRTVGEHYITSKRKTKSGALSRVPTIYASAYIHMTEVHFLIIYHNLIYHIVTLFGCHNVIWWLTVLHCRASYSEHDPAADHSFG